MSTPSTTPRRTFLGGAVAAAAAAALPTGVRAASRRAAPDDWIDEVPGQNRCLFDFNQHKNGIPLLHVLNYLNTYSAAYGTSAGQVGAAATLYGIGGASSIALGFDDEIWAKYELGAYTGLSDANGRAYTRNVFRSPEASDAHLLTDAMQIPALPMFGDAVQGLGIESLQQMGTKFIMCNNALTAWTFELAALGKGSQEEIDAELRAHLLPGVTIVPAMVIAIEKAQEAGIRYNKQ
jgi:intracellular sulfur oxidation DsrE/DsrF family protein